MSGSPKRLSGRTRRQYRPDEHGAEDDEVGLLRCQPPRVRKEIRVQRDPHSRDGREHRTDGHDRLPPRHVPTSPQRPRPSSGPRRSSCVCRGHGPRTLPLELARMQDEQRERRPSVSFATEAALCRRFNDYSLTNASGRQTDSGGPRHANARGDVRARNAPGCAGLHVECGRMNRDDETEAGVGR